MKAKIIIIPKMQSMVSATTRTPRLFPKALWKHLWRVMMQAYSEMAKSTKRLHMMAYCCIYKVD